MTINTVLSIEDQAKLKDAKKNIQAAIKQNGQYTQLNWNDSKQFKRYPNG